MDSSLLIHKLVGNFIHHDFKGAKYIVEGVPIGNEEDPHQSTTLSQSLLSYLSYGSSCDLKVHLYHPSFRITKGWSHVQKERAAAATP